MTNTVFLVSSAVGFLVAYCLYYRQKNMENRLAAYGVLMLGGISFTVALMLLRMAFSFQR